MIRPLLNRHKAVVISSNYLSSLVSLQGPLSCISFALAKRKQASHSLYCRDESIREKKKQTKLYQGLLNQLIPTDCSSCAFVVPCFWQEEAIGLAAIPISMAIMKSRAANNLARLGTHRNCFNNCLARAVSWFRREEKRKNENVFNSVQCPESRD